MSAPDSLGIILVADDDADDLFLLRRMLVRAGIKNPVVSLRDGDEVVSFLRPVVSTGNKGVQPCLVLLDIKMPRLDGFEVLRWIRKQSVLKTLPVIMLSGSDEPRDQKRATELGATRYVVKHPKPEVFAQMLVPYSSPG